MVPPSRAPIVLLWFMVGEVEGPVGFCLWGWGWGGVKPVKRRVVVRRRCKKDAHDHNMNTYFLDELWVD